MLCVTGVRCHRRPALFHRDEAGRRHRCKARAARARAGELQWRSAARCYTCCWGLCRAHALAMPCRYPHRSCGFLCMLVRCAGLRQIHPSADHAQAKADKLLPGLRECTASHSTGAHAHPLIVWCTQMHWLAFHLVVWRSRSPLGRVGPLPRDASHTCRSALRPRLSRPSRSRRSSKVCPWNCRSKSRRTQTAR